MVSDYIRDHIRSNIWGIAACFIAMMGAAVAASASDGDPRATKAASAKQQIKKLKRTSRDLERRLAALEGKPGPTIPASLPPSGPASGELAGSYPNPTIGAVAGLQLAESTSPNGGISFGPFPNPRLFRTDTSTLRADGHLVVDARLEVGDDAFLGDAIGDATFISGETHLSDFLSLDINNAPAAIDCDGSAEAGRLVFSATENELWVCDGASGWKQVGVS